MSLGEEDARKHRRTALHPRISSALLGPPGLHIPRDADGIWRLFLWDKARNTKLNYGFDLRCFARFMGIDPPTDALQALLDLDAPKANATVVAYVGHLRSCPLYGRRANPSHDSPSQVGYAWNTINRRIYALRSVVELARLCGLVTWTLGVKMRKAEPVRNTRGPGPEGYQRLLATVGDAVERARHAVQECRVDGRSTRRAQRSFEIALRDQVLLRLLHDSGLRRCEAASVEWPLGVILEAKPRVLVLEKARTRPRWVWISTQCASAVSAYLPIRGNTEGYLLRGTGAQSSSGKMNLATINKRVAHWSRCAATRTTPHGLRHTAITTVLDLTRGDYRLASQWSRHLDPSSLRTYDDALREDDRRLTERISDPTGARPHDEGSDAGGDGPWGHGRPELEPYGGEQVARNDRGFTLDGGE